MTAACDACHPPSGEAVDFDGFLTAFDTHRAEGGGAGAEVAGALEHFARDQDLGVEFLVELLDARGEDHDVAGDGVLLTLLGADVAADRVAGMQADADLDAG